MNNKNPFSSEIISNVMNQIMQFLLKILNNKAISQKTYIATL
jgi:hypothetical protein